MYRRLKAQTLDQQIENCLVALDMVESLPARAFVPRLNDWQNECGSAACLGGWVAVHPYFRKKGVRQSVEFGEDGFGNFAGTGEKYAPLAYDSAGREIWSSDIAAMLFGNGAMFYAEQYREENKSAKRIALDRIKAALNDLLFY